MAKLKALAVPLFILSLVGFTQGCDCGSTASGRQNLPPVADAGEDGFVTPGAKGSLTGSGTDPDGDSVTYAWSQVDTGGDSVPLTGADTATLGFTAPVTPQTLTFQLVVSDGQVESQPDMVDVSVNTLPVADAGEDQTVTAGDAASLDGSGSSDADGDDLTYSWVQVDTGGAIVILDDATSATPGFTAPAEAQALTFRLTVNDGKQDSQPDLVTVTVEAEPVNTPPEADAGLNQEVYVGDSVTLYGSGTDADGDTLTYAWAQSDGTEVVLSDASAAEPSFTAPDAPGVLVFSLTVNDGTDDSDPDTVQVRVLDPFNASPMANAGPDQEVEVSSLVLLAGSGSDADGDALTYQWAQVSGDPVVLSDETDPAASFTAPDTAQNLVFELTASDGLGSSDPDRVTIVVSDTPVNGAPIASAGEDQVVEVNSPVILSGSGWDPDPIDTLTYQWTQIAGDEVVLADPTAASTTFTAPALQGLLVFQLEVNDGSLTSAPDTVEVEVRDSTLNTPPVADAGLDATVEVDSAVTLYGSGTDADGDPLTYQWTQTEGDDVTLDDDQAASPSFTAPATAQTLKFELEVNDGYTDSDPDEVVITVEETVVNQKPVADAGMDQEVVVSTEVTLDGTLSSDPDGDPLTYLWTQIEGEPVELSDPASPQPTFTAPEDAGTLLFQLGVHDGTAWSDADSVTITVVESSENTPPVADAGLDQQAAFGDNVQLDGTGSSDLDGDELTYAWLQIEGEPVELDAPTSPTPGFTAPDVAGVLTFQLVVNDGTVSSPPDTVDVEILDPSNQQPAANAGPDQEVQTGVEVTLAGSGTDGDGDPLTYLWTQTQGEAVTLSDDTDPAATFTAPATAQTLVFELVANDGTIDSDPDSVTIVVSETPTNHAPVANAGDDQAVYPGDVVTMAGSGTDEDSDPLTYLWAQTAGDTVVLSDETDPAATFTAPLKPQSLTFELTAHDGLLGSAPDAVDIVIENRVPTADAGEDATVAKKTLVNLDGSGSSDPDGHALGFAWVFTGVPTGSALTDGDITDATTAAPSFTPDISGEFVLELTVDDGYSGTDADSVTITATNGDPVASAGEDRIVAKKTLVNLDGSGSSDPDGDAITYAWVFDSVPAASGLTDGDISAADTAAPSFTPDVSGEFVLELTVTDVESATSVDTVSLTATNGAPVADAGPDQADVPKKILVNLDGSGSSDPNGDVITYAWTFDSVPAGSTLDNADITDATTAAPSFTPDISGTFVLELVVTDEELLTGSDTVSITAVNQDPVAEAGEDQVATKNTLINLDGSGSSDPDGDSITYLWAFDSRPTDSTLADGDITDATTAAPSFTPDVSGAFVLKLVVTDEESATGEDTVSITATNTAPVADAGPDQADVPKNTLVNLDGSGSSDPNGDTITYAWTFDSLPAGSTLTSGDIIAADTETPSFTPDISGTFVLQLVVTDEELLTGSDTVSIFVLNQDPIADAGPDQADVLKKVQVDLDGTGSSDPDGDAITYLWTFEVVPGGSTLTNGDIANPDQAQANFTPDISGVYVLQLTVTDVESATDIDTVSITAVNQAPTADAGADDSVQNLNEICLDGSSSSDPDGDVLSYTWIFTLLPVGTSLTNDDITGADTAAPCFTPDVIGTFNLQLTVDDGDSGTDSDTVAITSLNNLPTADAGEDQRVVRGALVRLDGSGSSDPDGHPLTYDWQQTAGDAVALDPDNTTVDPSFNAPGTPQTLSFDLTVDDGHSGTDLDSVDIVVNSPPVPDPGPDQDVKPREHVTLAGSATDDDGDPLTYEWIQISGAPVELSDETDPAAEFDAPDFNTNLVFYLRAHDGYEYEEVDPSNTVTIRVFNTRPVADAGPDQLIGAGQIVTLDGTGSYDDDAGDVITYQWEVVGGPPVVLSDPSAPDPTFLSGSPGDVHVLSLVVDDGIWPSLPDLVYISVQPLGPAVYVDQNDPDSLDDPMLCGTRDQPCRSIGVGYQVAANQDPMLDVWVAQGTYDENLVFDLPISLFGGYQTEDFDTRDWTVHLTVIRPDALQTDGVRFQGGVTSAFNGFFVLAQGVDDCGVPTQAAITVLDASPTISDNYIGFDGGSFGAQTTYGVRLVGITSMPTPTITGNTITGGPGCAMLGSESVGLDPGPLGLPSVVGNLIDGGTAHNSTGMRITRPFDPAFQLDANTIQGGGRSLTMRSVGLFLGDQPSDTPVNDWLISGNTFRGGVGELAVGLWVHGDRNVIDGATLEGEGGPDGALSSNSYGVRLGGVSGDPTGGNTLQGCTCRGGRGRNATAVEVSGTGALVLGNTILGGGLDDDPAQSSTGLYTHGKAIEVSGNLITGGHVTTSGGSSGLTCLACTGTIHDNWISGSSTTDGADPSVGLRVQTGDIMPTPDEPEVFLNTIVGGLGDDRNIVTGMQVTGLGSDPYVHDNVIAGADGPGALVSRGLEVSSSATGEYELNEILGQEAEQQTQGAVFTNAGAALLHDCYISGGYLTPGRSTGVQIDVSNGMRVFYNTILGGLTEMDTTRGVALNGGAENWIVRNSIWAGESAWLGAGAFTAGYGVEIQGRSSPIAGTAGHIHNNFIGGGDHPWTYGVAFSNGTANVNGNVIYGGEATGGFGIESVGIEIQGANALGPIGTARNNIVHAGTSPGNRFSVRVRVMTIVAAIDNNDLMPVDGGVTALLREETMLWPPNDYLDIAEVNALGYANDNISEDPMWVDSENGDFHLLDGSLCIDRGTPEDDAGMNPPPKDDWDPGGVRPFNGVYDIGLDEWGTP